MTLKQQLVKAAKEAAKFNTTFKVGYKIDVRQDDDSICTWTVRHEATIISGDAVIWTEEHRSAYLAERVIYPRKRKSPIKE